MRILYFDCFSGISGDMTLGALLDLGVDENLFLQELKKINLDGYELKVSRSVKNGITGNFAEVILLDHDHRHEHNHSSDHNQKSGHEHEHHHDHSHHHDHNHDHDHDHDHDHHNSHTHEHHHRSYKDIKKLIDESEISNNAKKMAVNIFTKLAVAEGKIHGVPMEEVHFHEVGAVDSIVDIVGTAILLDILGVEKMIASPVPTGSGMVRCQHGLIPVPAPATLELLKGIPIYSKGIKGEMVTPTGAAILSALCSEFGEFPNMIVESIGYGMGKKNFDIPNCLRVCIGEEIKK